MPMIQTAEEAVNAAERFLNRYHAFRQLQSVTKDDGLWRLKFDVGVIQTEIVSMAVSVEDGQVLEYAKGTAQ